MEVGIGPRCADLGSSVLLVVPDCSQNEAAVGDLNTPRRSFTSGDQSRPSVVLLLRSPLAAGFLSLIGLPPIGEDDLLAAPRTATVPRPDLPPVVDDQPKHLGAGDAQLVGFRVGDSRVTSSTFADSVMGAAVRGDSRTAHV